MTETKDPLFAAVRRMSELEQEKERYAAIVADLNREYDEIRRKTIPDLMNERGIRNMTFEGLGRVQLAADCFASIVAENKERAWQFLRDCGDDGMITQTVNGSTFKAWARRKLEAGVELPPDLFKVEPFLRASIVKV